MRTRPLLTAAVLVVLAGCATTRPTDRRVPLIGQPYVPPPPDPIETALAHVPSDLSVVSDSTHAKEFWERAQLWIVHHSRWKVQTATDVLIETYNPPTGSASYGFTVTREPIGEGRYRIVVDTSCGNYNCKPLPNDVSRAFYYYVRTGNDVFAGVVPLGSGIN